MLDNPTSPFASGLTVTEGRAEFDHELRSSLFLRAFADAGESQSQSGIVGVASNDQTQFGFGASVIWDINRSLRATLSYSYERRLTGNTPNINVDTGSGNFISNTILIGVSFFK